MSRSNYSDDCEYLGLYRGNVERSMRSKAGQARLRELRDALLEMPVKALVADDFLRPSGEACALGAWSAKHAPAEDRPKLEAFEGNDYDTQDLLAPYKWPKLVVWETVYQNDEHRYTYRYGPGPHQKPWVYGNGREWAVCYSWPETPEERYERMLAWVTEQIIEPSTEATR